MGITLGTAFKRDARRRTGSGEPPAAGSNEQDFRPDGNNELAERGYSGGMHELTIWGFQSNRTGALLTLTNRDATAGSEQRVMIQTEQLRHLPEHRLNSTHEQMRLGIVSTADRRGERRRNSAGLGMQRTAAALSTRNRCPFKLGGDETSVRRTAG